MTARVGMQVLATGQHTPYRVTLLARDWAAPRGRQLHGVNTHTVPVRHSDMKWKPSGETSAPDRGRL
jgi:hypothetical protein